ncbi:MAG: alpha/beta fold hydrolase [Gammaproteobacteria bacterium]
METVDLVFTEFGDPHAEPLVILHGFFASSRNWRRVAETLSDSFRVFVADMRNHGASPHHPQMDYVVMAADLERFIERRGLKKVHILGHSMGGKIAMWFALNRPACVAKLIVADIAPVTYRHSFDNTIQALKMLPLAEISNRKQAEALLADAIPELSYRQFLLQNLVLIDDSYEWRINLDIFDRMGPNITAFPDSAHLPPYRGKALFIAGADSNFVREKDIARLFPEADLVKIANAGHWLHVQQPENFIESVGNFLKFC